MDGTLGIKLKKQFPLFCVSIDANTFTELFGKMSSFGKKMVTTTL